MCGLFGAIRLPGADSKNVSLVLHALGCESDERGRDSAGLALFIAEEGKFDSTQPTAEDARSSVLTIDGVAIVKSPGAFKDFVLPDPKSLFAEATVFLGHTRYATQGSTSDLANASPLLAGALVGTHNGDIDIYSVPNSGVWRHKAVGRTDTEVLFLALNRNRADRRKMTSVLRSVRGRAALAFADRGRPDRIYLARTALSPLSYAYDQDGNFYYASNPDWFRRAQQKIPSVVFTDATLVPEGHLLTVSTINGSILDARRFTPTCREADIRLLNTAVYRGFTAEDKATDLTLHRHQVAQRLGAWPNPGSVSVARTSTPSNSPSPASEALSSTVGYDADLDSLPVVSSGIDIDEAERLCWNGSEFDFVTFEMLLSLDYDEATQLMNQLRQNA